MTKMITLKGAEWTRFIAENENDAEAADAVATVKATLAKLHAELLPTYKGSTDYTLGNTRISITLTVPA